MPKKEKIQIEIEIPSKVLELKHAACPKGHLLLDDEVKFHGHPSIKVKVKYKKETGFLHLDPVYGSYNKIEEGISLPENAVVEFFCPECNESLLDEHDNCQLCASPLFVLNLPKQSVVECCTKKSCLYHKMKIVNAEQSLDRLFEDSTLESYL